MSSLTLRMLSGRFDRACSFSFSLFWESVSFGTLLLRFFRIERLGVFWSSFKERGSSLSSLMLALRKSVSGISFWSSSSGWGWTVLLPLLPVVSNLALLWVLDTALFLEFWLFSFSFSFSLTSGSFSFSLLSSWVLRTNILKKAVSCYSFSWSLWSLSLRFQAEYVPNSWADSILSQ